MEYQFAYDGDEYVIEVPFENLLFARSEKTDVTTNGKELNEIKINIVRNGEGKS